MPQRPIEIASDRSMFIGGVAAFPPPQPQPPQPPGPLPFITISRQAGAGGWALAQRLAAHLNRVDPNTNAWDAYDEKLLDKVATDHKLSRRLIETLDDRSASWVEDFFANISSEQHPGDDKVYYRVKATIRALAHQGRNIIVGRGGVYITRDIPTGVHLRLVAPIRYRIENFARMHGMSKVEAEERVRAIDAEREKFHRTYWPDEVLSLELFTMTLNTEPLSEDVMIECIMPLIQYAGVVQGKS